MVSDHEVWRDGAVHVLSERCATCIFRGGNLMHLESGRVKEMVDHCLANDSVIPCHKTIYVEGVRPAVCRGFFDAYAESIWPLRLAAALDYIREEPPPP